MGSLDTTDENRSTESFPFYRFEGTYRKVGQQYGESCRNLIELHKEYALERLRRSIKFISMDDIEKAALEYRPFVQKYAPFFDEELQGLAEGANISLGEAYFLQLRAEIYQHLDATDECTTFAVSSEATSNGIPIIGQNADLPSFYKEVSVVVEARTGDDASTLMLTPAGQISYIGINDTGLAVFANFIESDGWRVGFPRYLLSRLALTQGNVKDAIKTVSNVYRASSRNLIMMDKNGQSVDLETIPDKVGEVTASNGLLEHSNHFISEDLLNEERKTGEALENSKIRLSRIKKLLRDNYGQIDVEVMQNILRDRENAPHTLCREPGDFGMDYGSDTITFASVIAEPSKGRIWIAKGPPNKYQYNCYSLL